MPVPPIPPYVPEAPAATAAIAALTGAGTAIGGLTGAAPSPGEAALTAAGIVVPPAEGEDFTRDQAEALLAASGVDVADAAVQALLSDPNIVQKLGTAAGRTLIPQFAALWPRRAPTTYEQVAGAFGFQQGYPTPPVTPGRPQLAAFEQIPSLARPVTGVHIDPETGAMIYPNGVIVDPTTGQVFFPPDENAAGSLLWLRKVQQEWSPEQIATWRQRLVDFGYLGSDAAKGGIDTEFLNALVTYHQNRYALGFGKPVPQGPVSGGGDELTNLRLLRGQIQNDVRAQFNRVFGDDPSDDELAEWTSFVIRTGMTLQRKGLPPEAAAAEAEERAISRLEANPQAEFLREQAAENTELHDALIQAVVATRGLMS